MITDEIKAAYCAAMDAYPRCASCGGPLWAPASIKSGHCWACCPNCGANLDAAIG